MKTTFTFCILLLVSLISIGQRSTFNISIGPAIPLGKFAPQEEFSRDDAFAGIGQFINFSYRQARNSKFGYSVSLHLQRNPVHNNKFERGLANMDMNTVIFTPGGPPSTVPESKFSNWSAKNATWFMNTLLLGSFVNVTPNSNNTTLDFEASLGPSFIYSPKLDAESISPDSAARFVQNKNSAFGIMFSASATLRKQIKAKVFFAGVSFMQSTNMNFNNTKTVITVIRGRFGSPGYSISQQTATSDIKRSLTSLNVHVGIAFPIK